MNGEPPVFISQLTSVLIFIPVLVALFFSKWGDFIILSFLGITSIWYHTYHSRLSYYVDQISIAFFVSHCSILAISNFITSIIFFLYFGYILILYSYGKEYNCFCYDPNINIGDKYHASIHILGIFTYCISVMFFLPNNAHGIFFNIFNY
jgi:hypothetical protein